MSGALSLLLVQPWFTAPGHPEQFLLHTARALAREPGIGFLIPNTSRRHAPETVAELATLGTVLGYRTPPGGFPAATAAAIGHVRASARSGWRFERVLYLDAHLPVLLGLAAAGMLGDQTSGALVLQGPERGLRSSVRRQLLHTALRKAPLRLYCRNDELTSAWRAAVPGLADRFDALPSLELPRPEHQQPRVDNGSLRLGLLGQIRKGKGIERLVAACTPAMDVTLTIAGPYASVAARRRYEPLLAPLGVTGRFLSEQQLYTCTAEQDYVLLLYDDWDERMESGVFYLAAASGRPVVVYRGGWCERQVATFDCGVVFERAGSLDALASLPRPGSAAYQRMCEGMRRFAEEHRADRLVDRFMATLRGQSAHAAAAPDS